VSGRDPVSRTRSRPCRETSRVPASARQSQNVPVSYSREIQISPLQATLHAYLQVFCASPLTDSNRRPLLSMEVLGRYWRARADTRDHAFPAIGGFTPCRLCPRVPRACSV
jgi:hypothetical protein